MRQNIISAEIKTVPNRAKQAALALQRLGFRIHYVEEKSEYISVEGPQSLWVTTFNVSFEPRKKTSVLEVEGGEDTYHKALVDEMRIPAELQNLITDVLFQEPPGFF